MSSHKLIYFDAYGRGEGIRLLFKCGGIPFEDKRVTFAEWPEIKKGDTCPYKVLPVLIVDDKTTVCETLAIMRYAAAIAGLEPDNKLLRGQLDSVSFRLSEMGGDFYKIMFEKDPEAKASKDKEYREITFPSNCKVWEKYLKEIGRKFFGGDKICYVDVGFFNFINLCFMSGANSPEVPEELKSFPSLCALYERVYEHPPVKEHCNSRKKCDF